MMHWRRRSEDQNAIVKIGDNRTSYQGQLISKLEDTKDLTCKSKKDKQYNGQVKRDKRTNNDLQNNTLKTKDQAKRTPLKTEGTSGALDGEEVPAPLVASVVLLQLQIVVHQDLQQGMWHSFVSYHTFLNPQLLLKHVLENIQTYRYHST